jgi:hypothetical protein
VFAYVGAVAAISTISVSCSRFVPLPFSVSMFHHAYNQSFDFTTNSSAHSTSSNAFTVYNASSNEFPAPEPMHTTETGVNLPFTTNGFAVWPSGYVNGLSQMSSMAQALTHEQLLASGNIHYLNAINRIATLEVERNTLK